MRYCGILALPRAVLRYSYPPYAPLFILPHNTVRIHSIIHVKSVEESREIGRQITDVDLLKLMIKLILSLLSKRKLSFYKQSMCFNHLFDEKP